MGMIEDMPEYGIKIELWRKNDGEAEELAHAQYKTHAPSLEVAMPLLNDGINERFEKLVQMAEIAEDGYEFDK